MKKLKRKFIFIVMMIVIMLTAGNFINNIRADRFDESDHQRKWYGSLNPFMNRDKRIHILVFGVDAVDRANSENKRADTIMLISIDSTGKNPVLLSIPRDSRVTIPGRKAPDKINHSHVYGGPELLVATVENLLNIDIDYYIRLNYKAVEEVVDVLGGIEIDVPMDMRYSDPYDDPPLNIDIQKGRQILDGKNVLHFLRFRKGYTNQDLGRIEAQQQFMKAVIDKGLSSSTLVKLPQLVNIFFHNVDTNIPKSKMFFLALKGPYIKPDEITKITLSGKSSMINGIYYYVLNEKEIKEITENYLISTKQEQGYQVEILNGCGVQGMATKYANILEDTHITIDYIGNYENYDVEVSFIQYHYGYKKEAQRLMKLLGISKIEKVKEDNQEMNIRIVIGKDLVP